MMSLESGAPGEAGTTTGTSVRSRNMEGIVTAMGCQLEQRENILAFPNFLPSNLMPVPPVGQTQSEISYAILESRARGR